MPDRAKDTPLKSGYTVDRISVGHTYAELYLRFGDGIIVLTPSVAKKMTLDLMEAISRYEDEHGDIRMKPKKAKESLPRKIVKSLYKSRRVSSKLVSVNTRKRKS